MPKSSIAIRTPRSLIAASRARGLLDVAHQRRLGDLDRQRSGGSPLAASASRCRRSAGRCRAGGPRRSPRSTIAWPACSHVGALAAGLAQHPAPDLDDQAGLLEQRDEGVGLDERRARGAASGSAPRRPSGACRRGRASAGRRGRTRRCSSAVAEVHLELHAAPGRCPACRSRTSRSGCGRPTWPGTSRCRRRAAGPRRCRARPTAMPMLALTVSASRRSAPSLKGCWSASSRRSATSSGPRRERDAPRRSRRTRRRRGARARRPRARRPRGAPRPPAAVRRRRRGRACR